MMRRDWKMNMYTSPLTVFKKHEVIQEVRKINHTILP